MANILVIEDHDSLGSLYQRVLGCIGHDVTVASTGLAAIAGSETQNLNMVILDFMLPGMKATQVVNQLTRLGVPPDSPLALSSTMAQSEVAALARNLGANCSPPKPIDIKSPLALGSSLSPKTKE